eukprot:gene12925-biopygen5240
MEYDEGEDDARGILFESLEQANLQSHLTNWLSAPVLNTSHPGPASIVSQVPHRQSWSFKTDLTRRRGKSGPGAGPGRAHTPARAYGRACTWDGNSGRQKQAVSSALRRGDSVEEERTAGVVI